jgi:hypothetical protein
MRVLEPFNTEHLVLEIPVEEVKKITKLDMDTVGKLSSILEKYLRWTNDVKKIRTKEMLQR